MQEQQKNMPTYFRDGDAVADNPERRFSVSSASWREAKCPAAKTRGAAR